MARVQPFLRSCVPHTNRHQAKEAALYQSKDCGETKLLSVMAAAFVFQAPRRLRTGTQAALADCQAHMSQIHNIMSQVEWHRLVT